MNATLNVPNGADLTQWVTRLSPGDTLSLAAGGTYTHAPGASGFTNVPSGTSSAHITIQGNGATVNGGSVGFNFAGKSYIDVSGINFRDQTSCCVQMQNSHHLEITDCTFKSTVNPSAFIDVLKNRSSNNVWYRRCTILESYGVATCDGFEWRDCDNCGCEDCYASGLKNGADALDNGHGFEVYGESASEICTNIQFIRCHSDDCRVGFSVENPISGAAHTVTCTDCTTGNHSQYDYFAETATTLTINNYDGGTRGGAGTYILN